MRADCEVRVGTVSEGMSRLARLFLLQWSGCMCMYVERIHLRIKILCQMVIPLSVYKETDKSMDQCFGQKRVFHQEGRKAYHTRQSKPMTLEGNRGVTQIKQPCPAAAVCACVL